MPKQFRNVSDDDRVVKYGVVGHPHGVLVPVDGLVDVEDHAIDSYACQPAVWRAEGDSQTADSQTAKSPPALLQASNSTNEEA